MLDSRAQIETRSLLDTGATGIAFIDKAIARHVCNVLKILFLPLAKPKPLKGFDEKPARPITHAIYPTLTVQDHFKLPASMLVTSLGQHPIILGKPWMQKHGVILDMSCDKLTFWLGHYQHSGTSKKSEDELLVSSVKELAPTLITNEPMGKEKAASINTPKHVIPANKKAAPKAATLHAAPKTSNTKRARDSESHFESTSATTCKRTTSQGIH